MKRQVVFYWLLAAGLWAAPELKEPVPAPESRPVHVPKEATPGSSKPALKKKSAPMPAPKEAVPAQVSPALKKKPASAPVPLKKAAFKKINVVTTLSVLAALTREVGGDLVNVASLLSANEDPHFVKAKPTYKSLVQNADLFFQVDRDFELWVPQVIESANNEKLSMGTGRVITSEGVSMLEVPEILSRKHGDIHASGNPHMWLSPTVALKMASNIRAALVKVDKAHEGVYNKNFGAFKQKLANKLFGEQLVEATNGNSDFLWRLHEGKTLNSYLSKRKLELGGWLKDARSIDYGFLSYHPVLSYFVNEFALKPPGQIEENSGVPPGLKYQNELVKSAIKNKITHVVAANYYLGHRKLIDLIAQKIGGNSLFVALDCGPAQSYVDLIDQLVQAMVKFKAVKKPQ